MSQSPAKAVIGEENNGSIISDECLARDEETIEEIEDPTHDAKAADLDYSPRDTVNSGNIQDEFIKENTYLGVGAEILWDLIIVRLK